MMIFEILKNMACAMAGAGIGFIIGYLFPGGEEDDDR